MTLSVRPLDEARAASILADCLQRLVAQLGNRDPATHTFLITEESGGAHAIGIADAQVNLTAMEAFALLSPSEEINTLLGVLRSERPANTYRVLIVSPRGSLALDVPRASA